MTKNRSKSDNGLRTRTIPPQQQYDCVESSKQETGQKRQGESQRTVENPYGTERISVE